MKKITDGTLELDIFDDSSKLYTLKDWTSKAIPLDQAFAVLGDIIETDSSQPNKKFDV